MPSRVLGTERSPTLVYRLFPRLNSDREFPPGSRTGADIEGYSRTGRSRCPRLYSMNLFVPSRRRRVALFVPPNRPATRPQHHLLLRQEHRHLVRLLRSKPRLLRATNQTTVVVLASWCHVQITLGNREPFGASLGALSRTAPWQTLVKRSKAAIKSDSLFFLSLRRVLNFRPFSRQHLPQRPQTRRLPRLRKVLRMVQLCNIP